MFLILKTTDWKEENYIKSGIVPFGWCEGNNRAIPNTEKIVAKVQTEEQDRHIIELEKENAELKNRNSELAGQKASLECWYGEAKELIGELISSLSVVGECEEECKLLNRAEEFLEENT